MTNKQYAKQLIGLYNSANEQFDDFIGFEEPIIEIEREKCDIEEIRRELEKCGYNSQIRYDKKNKQQVVFITKG